MLHRDRRGRRPRVLPRSRLTWLGIALMALAVLLFVTPIPPTPGHWLNRWAISSVGILGILGGSAAIGSIALRRERSLVGLVTAGLGVLWIVIAVGEFAAPV